ncbi:MAG TPA: ribonuclease R [Burkholderiaceae bacterium]|nr:ribonuclease R [Burkholderiaceae bacterium]
MSKQTKKSSTTEIVAGAIDLPPDFDPEVPSREAIMQQLRTFGKPMGLEALARALGAAVPLAVGFERRLRAMERDGQVFVNRQGKVQVNTKLEFIAGKVQGHRDGFGFLLRDDGGPDLFLPQREMLKVLHGDRVLAKIEGEYRGKLEGFIVEVLERRTDKLVGRFLRERGVCIVVPEDQRIKHDILIPAQETNGAEHGQVVSVQILQQPTRHTQPLGRVVEVLGEIDDPGMEIEIAVRKFGVPHEFSQAALEQADALPDYVQGTEIKGRVDLRDVPFITIDGEDARDFDDAVFCMPINIGTEKRKRSGWRLLVAIADVSHYVRPGDAIDVDALERGTSVYFPRRVIPMLPEALSNGICSLNPDVDRLVLVCDMVIAGSGKKAGQISAYQFYEAVIHSHARCTYTQVWEALQQPKGPAATALGDLLPHVRDLHELYQLFAAARVERGAIDFDTVETRIVCTPLGRIERIEAYVRNDAHKLIEECMLAANTCAAEFMTRNKRHGLYRVHEGPTPEKLQTLRAYLNTVGLTLEGGDDPGTNDYARLMQQARGRPDFEIIQTMALRSLQQAIYSPEQVGHFGLSYDHYAHFTSPIRRYPDLLTHRVIKGILKGKRYVPKVDHVAASMVLPRDEQEEATWEKLGLVLSAAERRADDASRDVEAWLKCWFIKEHVGEVFSGRVTGVAPFGLFITLETLFVEGLVHVSELGSDYFQYNEASHELRGERTGMRYRLTDPVQVQVARVDLEARRIEFRLVKGTSFKTLTAPEPADAPRRIKRAASTKPKSLKGTSSQRRADAKRTERKAAAEKARKTTKARR